MSIKNEIQNEIEWYIKNWDWVINGSYGQEYYEKYRSWFNDAITSTPKRKIQKLRMIAINGFTTLVMLENNCSYGFAQKCLIDILGHEKLEKLNEQFIQELQENELF